MTSKTLELLSALGVREAVTPRTVSARSSEEIVALHAVVRRLTSNEIWTCRYAAAAGWCGELCDQSFESMQAIAAKGLVTDLVPLPGRGRYHGRYEYTMTEAGEAVAVAWQQLLEIKEPPNATSEGSPPSRIEDKQERNGDSLH